MKVRVAGLLLILGAVICGFTYSVIPVPAVLISVIGGFALGFSYLCFTSVYGGKIWGIKIKSSTKSKWKQILSAIGLVIGGYGILYTGLIVFVSLFGGKFIELLISLIGFVVALVVGPLIGKKILEKSLAKEQSASVLGELEIFKDIDANIDNATQFVVGFEGVALFSETNYCYAVYLYEDYQLGELTTTQEVALAGTYFVQKYYDRYTFKVDVEVIPGEPGHTAIAVGTGGIGIARVQGTPDKHLFRSYIFTKRG